MSIVIDVTKFGKKGTFGLIRFSVFISSSWKGMAKRLISSTFSSIMHQCLHCTYKSIASTGWGWWFGSWALIFIYCSHFCAGRGQKRKVRVITNFGDYAVNFLISMSLKTPISCKGERSSTFVFLHVYHYRPWVICITHGLKKNVKNYVVCHKLWCNTWALLCILQLHKLFTR